MHFQKPLCLNANNSLFCEAFSRGSFSSMVFLPLMVFRNFSLAIKKPPLIQPSDTCGFSLNFMTLFFLMVTSPNLAGGLTARYCYKFFAFCVKFF